MRNKLEIILVMLACLLFIGLALIGFSKSQAQSTYRNIMVLGDSNTAAVNESNRYVVQLQDALPNDSVINLGVSGDTTWDVEARIQNNLNVNWDINKENICLFLIGTNNLNDFNWVSVSDAYEGLEDSLTIADNAGCRNIVLTYPPTNDNEEKSERIRLYNNKILWKAETPGYETIDLSFEFQWVGTEGKLFPRTIYYKNDGVHIKEVGHTEIANTILDYLN